MQPPPATPSTSLLRRLGVYIFMLLWSVVGLIVTELDPSSSVGFWELTTLIFAGIAIWRAFQHERPGRPLLALKQVGHWGAFLVAMFLLHTKQVAEVLTQDALGLVMLLLLAVATFLDGLYVDWRFCVVGALLAAGVVLLTVLANALPLIIVIGLAAGGILYLLRHKERIDEPGAA